MACVYQHRRLDNNSVFYVGIGKDVSRAYSKKRRNKYWNSIVKNVGYDIDILIQGCSIEDAKLVEIGMISDYGRMDLKTGSLANMTDGGDGTINHSPEVIEIIKNKLKGRKASPETIKKCAASKIGLKQSSETCVKISKRLKNKSKSESHKLNLSISRKGKGNRATPINQYSKDGVFINTFNNQKEASIFLNIGRGSINNNLKGISHLAGGYIFKYKN